MDFVQEKSYNPNTKVYLGLPAAPDYNVVYDLEMYLQPNEANEIIKALQCEYKHAFGGVMLYEATFSQNNQIQGQSYAVSLILKSFSLNQWPLLFFDSRRVTGTETAIIANTILFHVLFESSSDLTET